MTVRRMTIVRSPGTDSTPMLKISNLLLPIMGFAIGAPVMVAYQPGIITVKILNHEHQLQKSSSPISLPSASCATNAGKIDGPTGRSESNSTDVTKAVPTSPQPLRYILTGSWHHV